MEQANTPPFENQDSAELKNHDRLRELLHQIPVEQASPDLVNKVLAELRNKKTHAKSTKEKFLWISVSVIALTLILLLIHSIIVIPDKVNTGEHVPGIYIVTMFLILSVSLFIFIRRLKITRKKIKETGNTPY